MKHARSDYDSVQPIGTVVERLQQTLIFADELDGIDKGKYLVRALNDLVSEFTVEQQIKIPNDEPVFLIRGKDPIGHFVVEYYAHMAEDIGADRGFVRVVAEQARRMRDYAFKHAVKNVPDAPNGVLR